MNSFRALCLAGISLACLSAAPALAQQAFPATLAGHAILDANSFVEAPADAPEMLKTSGKFTADDRKRVDRLGAIEGVTGLSAPGVPRKTGISLPFQGQPVQGFSGIRSLGNGEFLVLTDNGFGSRANSPDAMLMLHRLKIDWEKGSVTRLDTLFLRDPDRKVPFLIVTEATRERYLTGGDFDIESVQPVGDKLYFGDEFGPYILVTDKSGKVLSVQETKVDGKPVRSPDHYAVTTPGAPGPVKFEAKRSKGFEGMAVSPDGKTLYPLLEGPLWNAEANGFEIKDSREYLRIAEFDTATNSFTGKSWKYRLEANGNAIGDFNMIDATSGLIIERDNGEGDPAKACPAEPKPDCFNAPAKFKRIYKIDLAQADTEGFVKKVGYIDLMAMEDPKKLARIGGADGKLSFPFITIENVDVVDAEHIVVGNDNNLPFSTGRTIGRNDDNEFVLLRVPELLSAK